MFFSLRGVISTLLLFFIHLSFVATTEEIKEKSITEVSTFVSAKRHQLTFYTEHFPPYNFELNGRLQGINFELVELMCQRALIECKFELMAWNRAFTQAKRKINTGVFSTSRTNYREQSFKWIGPLISSNNTFYKLKSRNDISINSNKELLDYTIAAPYEDVYTNVLQELGFKKDLNLLLVSKKFEAVKLFLAGKIDLLIATPITLSYQLGSRVNIVEPIIALSTSTLKGNYLALHPDTNPQLIARLSKALKELVEQGEDKRLHQKYKMDLGEYSLPCFKGH